jgi:hypothetical protein
MAGNKPGNKPVNKKRKKPESEGKEHTKNKRGSTREKHEKGQARRKRDQLRKEKLDYSRCESSLGIWVAIHYNSAELVKPGSACVVSLSRFGCKRGLMRCTMDVKSRMGLQAGDVCEIFRRFEPDVAMYCRVLDISDKWVIASRRDSDGEFLGVTSFELDSIFKIRYRSKHTILLFSNELLIDSLPPPLGDHLSVGWLKELESRFGCITVYNEEVSTDSVVIGSVYDGNKDVIFINEYRPISSLERTICAIPRAEITRVDAGGEYEKRLLSYYKS